MSGSRRKDIRHAIANRLIEVNTLAGSHVFATRSFPVDEESLPALIVRVSEEVCHWDELVTNARTYLPRSATVEVLAIVQSLEGATDELDDLCIEVEQSLESYTIPGIESADLRLQSTSIEDNQESTRQIAVAQLSYAVRYWSPYRDVMDPFVDWDGMFYQSGLFPGGRGVERSEPPEFLGQKCPIREADIEGNGQKIPIPPTQ